MSNDIASYADRAIALVAPHGSSHPCLICADARKALGHRPLIGAPEADMTVIALPLPPIHTVEPPVGARIAATRIGCDIAEYFQRQHDGERWCPRCQGWRPDWRSSDGRTPYCHPCLREYRRTHYQAVATQAEQLMKKTRRRIAYAGPAFSKRERAS